MSIATQIEALTENVAALSDARDDIITSINSKGVSATGHGYEDFAYDISQIDQSGSHSPVIAVADTGVISASCGGVTNTHTLSSSDDADFVAGNIKNGVTVFGVTGTHQGAGTYQSKTVTPNAAGQTVYPGSGYDALSSVVINGDADLVAGNVKKDINIFGVTGTFEGGTLEAKSVTPSASQQVITPSAGNYGLSSVTVAGDADLIGSNIRKDVNIFGVTGTYEADSTKDMYVQTDTGVQTGDLLVYSDQLVPSNIKKDIVIFGVTGTYEGFDNSAGSLIVCTCSSNITTVTATYGATTVTCYKSGNVAYVNIPYWYTGIVVLTGYDSSSSIIASRIVQISNINKYEVELSVTFTIYNSGTWASGFESRTWEGVSPTEYSDHIHFNGVYRYSSGPAEHASCTGGTLQIPIPTYGYSKFKITGTPGDGSGYTFWAIGYSSTANEACSYWFWTESSRTEWINFAAHTEVNSSFTEIECNINNGDNIIYLALLNKIDVTKIELV